MSCKVYCITRVRRRPHPPHVLSLVPKMQRVSQILEYCFPKLVIPVTDYTSTFCLIVPSSKRLPPRALVKSPISHLTGSRDYASQPVSSPSRPRISMLSNPRTGTTHIGQGIQRRSKKEWKQQRMGEYTENTCCGKHQCLNCSCSHLKHSHSFISMCSV